MAFIETLLQVYLQAESQETGDYMADGSVIPMMIDGAGLPGWISVPDKMPDRERGQVSRMSRKAIFLTILVFLVLTGAEANFKPAISASEIISPWIKAVNPEDKTSEIILKGAQNEHLLLGLEISSKSSGALEWRILPQDGAPPVSVKFFELHTVPESAAGQFPADCLVPWNSGLVKPAPLWRVITRLHIPPHTARGTYSYEIQGRQGQSIWRFPVKLTIWGFSLPQDLPITIMGNLRPVLQWFQRYPDFKAENFDRLIENYLRLIREYRFNAISGFYPLPVQQVLAGKPITSGFTGMLDNVVNTLNFRYFLLPAFPKVKEGIKEREIFFAEGPNYYRNFTGYLKRRGWLNKAIVAVWDEPLPEDYPKVLEVYKTIKEAAPDLKTLLASRTPEASLADYINIWLMHANYYDKAKVEEARQRGMEVWLYHNKMFYAERPPAYQRLVGWYLNRYDFSGSWSWSFNNWPEDPWTSPPGKHDFFRSATFFYPDPRNGEPLPTLRLEGFRRGLEDYLYFRLFQQAIDSGKISPGKAKPIQEHFKNLTEPLGLPPQKANWMEMDEIRQKIGSMLDKVD